MDAQNSLLHAAFYLLQEEYSPAAMLTHVQLA
jgi:hypothetical protein